MTITFPETKPTIDEIRQAIGRNVTFYYVWSSMPCPVCDLDPVTNESTDSFCETCSGLYWIPLYSGVSVLAHVSWGPFDQLNWVPGGQFFDGACGIQIEYNVTNLNLVNDSKYIVVDGTDLEVKNKTLRGHPEINRILVNLRERE